MTNKKAFASSKPKLLYVLHCYFNRAGTEQHTKDLTQSLKNDFDIYTVFPHEDEIWLLSDSRSPRHYPAQTIGWPLTPYQTPKITKSLTNILKQVDPDIIHVQHFYGWPLGVLDQLIAFRKPMLMTFHDYYAITPYYTLQWVNDARETLSPEYSKKVFGTDISDYLKERRAIITKSLLQIPFLITPSAYVIREYSKVFPFHYTAIEHGIKPYSVSFPREVHPGFRFGCVGSLLPQKGWESLVEAFVAVRKKHPHAELRLYGGEEDLAEHLRDGVTFCGIYEQTDLARITSEIDVGIISSIFPETFCLTLSELWLGGVPVAVSDIGNLSDRVTDGINGKKFRPGNSQDIAKTLCWFLEHDDWRSWAIPKPRLLDDMANEYRQMYEEVLRSA